MRSKATSPPSRLAEVDRLALSNCLVLWVVGGIIARRFPAKPRQAKVAAGTAGGATKPGALPPAQTRSKQQRAAQPAQDDDMAEIEALLKSRGIE